MMGLTFINAVVFGVQGNTLRALGKDTPLNQFLAGSAAGAIQCIICCPMELAKTRMQLQGTGEYKQKNEELQKFSGLFDQNLPKGRAEGHQQRHGLYSHKRDSKLWLLLPDLRLHDQILGL